MGHVDIQQIFSAWDEPAVQVPLELGRQIVHGAIRYARELGFEPHAGLRAGRRVSRGMGRGVRADLRPGRETDVYLRTVRRRGQDHPQAAPRPWRRELRLRAHDLRLTAGQGWRCRSQLTSEGVRTHRVRDCARYGEGSEVFQQESAPAAIIGRWAAGTG